MVSGASMKKNSAEEKCSERKLTLDRPKRPLIVPQPRRSMASRPAKRFRYLRIDVAHRHSAPTSIRFRAKQRSRRANSRISKKAFANINPDMRDRCIALLF